MNRTRRLGLLATAAGASLVALVVAILPGDGNGTGGDQDLVVDGPEVAPAAAFTVTSRVEDTAGPEPAWSTEVLTVRRPYEVRLERRDGEPPGGEIISATITNDVHRFSLGPSGVESLAGDLPPSIPAPVPSVPALRAAVAAGAATEVGPGQVLDEACTRFAWQAAGSGALTPPTDDERVESCITDDGLPLSEVITIGGRVVRRAEAVAVERSPDLGPETFFAGREPSGGEAAQFYAVGSAVEDGPPPDDHEPLGLTLPAGFERDRQATVIVPARPGAAPRQSWVRAFSRAGEAIVVEETLVRTPPPWREPEGVPVDLGAGRKGSAGHRLTSVEVRWMERDRWYRISATRPELALAVARAVEAR